MSAARLLLCLALLASVSVCVLGRVSVEGQTSDALESEISSILENETGGAASVESSVDADAEIEAELKSEMKKYGQEMLNEAIEAAVKANPQELVRRLHLSFKPSNPFEEFYTSKQSAAKFFSSHPVASLLESESLTSYEDDVNLMEMEGGRRRHGGFRAAVRSFAHRAGPVAVRMGREHLNRGGNPGRAAARMERRHDGGRMARRFGRRNVERVGERMMRREGRRMWDRHGKKLAKRWGRRLVHKFERKLERKLGASRFGRMGMKFLKRNGKRFERRMMDRMRHRMKEKFRGKLRRFGKGRGEGRRGGRDGRRGGRGEGGRMGRRGGRDGPRGGRDGRRGDGRRGRDGRRGLDGRRDLLDGRRGGRGGRFSGRGGNNAAAGGGANGRGGANGGGRNGGGRGGNNSPAARAAARAEAARANTPEGRKERAAAAAAARADMSPRAAAAAKAEKLAAEKRAEQRQRQNELEDKHLARLHEDKKYWRARHAELKDEARKLKSALPDQQEKLDETKEKHDDLKGSADDQINALTKNSLLRHHRAQARDRYEPQHVKQFNRDMKRLQKQYRRQHGLLKRKISKYSTAAKQLRAKDLAAERNVAKAQLYNKKLTRRFSEFKDGHGAAQREFERQQAKEKSLGEATSKLDAETDLHKKNIGKEKELIKQYKDQVRQLSQQYGASAAGGEGGAEDSE